MKKRSGVSSGFGLVVAIAVVAVVALVGGYFYSTNSVSAPTDREEGVDKKEDSGNSPQSLRALMGLGKNLTCSFSKIESDGSISGVIYISGEKMRGDFTTNVGGAGNISSNIIKNGDDLYVWSSAMVGKGIKMKATNNDDSKTPTESEQSVDWDQQMDYKCSDWNVDDSKFNVPTDVNFMDFSSKAGINTSAGTTGAAGVSGSVDISAGVNTGNQNQCSSCDQVPESARAQCRTVLGC